MHSNLCDGVYIADSSNYTQGRNGYSICKFTPHMMAGILSGKQCAVNIFQNPDRNASANYCIGNDGDLVCNVEEENRAWTSSNRANDYQAITVEVSNCEIGGDWKVSDAAWNKLVELAVDVCRRYNFRLNYDGTPNGSLTTHDMFTDTNCIPITSELLTKTGWKKLSEIELGEEVACANINDLSISFEEVEYIVPQRKQDTYTCNDLTATKDHRIVYFLQNEVNKNLYRIDYYKNYINTNTYIPLAGKNKFNGMKITDDMIKFYIAVQADGYYIKENNSYYGIQFHLSKERKIERLQEILDNIGLAYSVNTQSNGTVKINIWNQDGINIVKDLCETLLENKCFKWDWIFMNKHQASLFLQEIMYWDGCIVANKYSSTQKQNLDVVNAIAAINNCGSRIIGSEVMFRSNPYQTLNSSERRNSVSVKSRDSLTTVSCVSVKTGVILIRQNGKTFIVGNCPGPYLKSRMGELADTVNAILDGETPAPTPTPTPSEYTFEQFVKDVQRATGATWIDGIPGPDTLKHTITVSRETNKYHSVVTALERWFKQLGYYDGEIEADYGKTPIFGYGMEGAVKKYQKANGLKVVDGIITAHANTWKKLLKLS